MKKRKDQDADYWKKYYKKHKNIRQETQRKCYKKNRLKYLAKAKAKRDLDRKSFNARVRFQRMKIRELVLDAYGRRCSCCKENRQEFLAIDHIGGGGNEHRKIIGSKIYCWLKKNNFPKEGFRLLCHNCNMSRSLYGYCPHESENDAQVEIIVNETVLTEI